jgi:DnaD and phage-associated domain
MNFAGGEAMQDISISASAIDRLIAAHDGDVALLWLYLLKNPDGSNEDAARALCRTRAEIEAAREKLSRLEGTEVPAPAAADQAKTPRASTKLPPPDELPDYSAKDITDRSRSDARFAAIVGEAQRVLGRILSSSDLKKLFGLYDYLALPPEIIMMLLNYCVSLRPKGDPPSMRLIEKEGYVWANREILTIEQAEEYIAASEHRREVLKRASQLVGITGRLPSATESRYLSAWLDMGFDEELLEMAYDRTLTNTGGLKWSYMNGILKSWHEKGLHTAADVREKDTRRPRGQAGTPDRQDLGKILAGLDEI